MMLKLNAAGVEYDTSKSLAEQSAEVQQAVYGIVAGPFIKSRSTSEDCGPLAQPVAGKYPRLLRWPRRVWTASAAQVVATVLFQYPAGDAACMSEAAISYTVEPLS